MTTPNYDASPLSVQYYENSSWHSIRWMTVSVVRLIGVRSYFSEPDQGQLIVTMKKDIGSVDWGFKFDFPMRVRWNSKVIWFGRARDIKTVISPDNNPLNKVGQATEITALDALGDFQRMTLNGFPMPQETAASRIRRVESALGFSTSFIRQGPNPFDKVMQAQDRYSGNAFDVLSDIALATHSRWYTSAENVIKMRNAPAPITVTFADNANSSQIRIAEVDPGRINDTYVPFASVQNMDSDSPIYKRAANGAPRPYYRSEAFTVALHHSELQQWLRELHLEAKPPFVPSEVTSYDIRLLSVSGFELTTMAKVLVKGRTFYGTITGISYEFTADEFKAKVTLGNPTFFGYSGYASDYEADQPTQPPTATPGAPGSDDEDTPAPSTPEDEDPATTLSPDGGRVLVFTVDDPNAASSDTPPGVVDLNPIMADVYAQVWWLDPPSGGTQNDTLGLAISRNFGNVVIGFKIEGLRPDNTWYEVGTIYVDQNPATIDTSFQQYSYANDSAISQYLITGVYNDSPATVTFLPPPANVTSPVPFRTAVGKTLQPSQSGSWTFTFLPMYLYNSNTQLAVSYAASTSGNVNDDYYVIRYQWQYPNGNILSSGGVGYGANNPQAFYIPINAVRFKVGMVSGSFDGTNYNYAEAQAAADARGWIEMDGSNLGGGGVQTTVTVNGEAASKDGSVEGVPAVSLWHKDVNNDAPAVVETTGALYYLNTAVSGGNAYEDHYADGDDTASVDVELEAKDVVVWAAAGLSDTTPVPGFIGAGGLDFQFGSAHEGTGEADDPSSAIYAAVVETAGTYTITAQTVGAVSLSVYIVRAEV